MQKLQLTDINNEPIYPRTLGELVIMNDGTDVASHKYVDDKIRESVLNSEVGVMATYYTQEEADAANLQSGAVEGDENYIKAGDIKSPSTGLYAIIDELNRRIGLLEYDQLDDVNFVYCGEMQE